MKTIAYFSTIFSLSFLLVLAFAPDAMAQVVYVKSDAAGANDGSSWENAYTDLSTALASAPEGEIWVAASLYHPGSGVPDTFSTFMVTSQVDLYGGFAGNENSIEERDIAANPTVLSGDINNDDIEDDFSQNKSDNVFHVIVVDSLLEEKIIIDGFTIQGGNTSGDFNRPTYEWRGGGLFAYSAVEVRNCSFMNHFAPSGGGAYLSPAIPGGCDGSVFYNCSFRKNMSSNQAAGIYLESLDNITIKHCEFSQNFTTRGALYPNACTNVLVDSCQFVQNTSNALTDFGGALFSWQNMGLTISNTDFVQNAAGNGAAMYLDGREVEADSGFIVIDNCHFDDNAAADWGGGAIYVWRASYTLTGSVFDGNAAPNTGGHIYNGGENKNIIARDNSFRNGIAGWGGAVANYADASMVLFEDNEFLFNHANTSGGGVTTGFRATSYLGNNFFDNNTANFGAAIYAQNDSTTVIITESNFEGNTAQNRGGAVNLSGDIYGLVNQCSFLSNLATNGGAIGLSGSAVNPDLELTIQNSIFLFNSVSGQGGAIDISDMNTQILSCVFSLNSTSGTGYGGAIINNVTDSVTTEVYLTNNTFVENSSANGPCVAQWQGANEASATMYIQNNIMVDFTGDEYVVEDGEPVLISNGGNYCDDSAIMDLLGNPLDGMVFDPMFVDPNIYDYHLLKGSPMINAGVDEGAPDLDNDGNPRFGQVDVGAYEYQAVSTNEILPNNGELTVSPNPATDLAELKLENTWTGTLIITIFDQQGKVVRLELSQKTDDVMRTNLNISGIPAGIYRIAVSDGAYMIVTSMVKL